MLETHVCFVCNKLSRLLERRTTATEEDFVRSHDCPDVDAKSFTHKPWLSPSVIAEEMHLVTSSLSTLPLTTS